MLLVVLTLYKCSPSGKHNDDKIKQVSDNKDTISYNNKSDSNKQDTLQSIFAYLQNAQFAEFVSNFKLNDFTQIKKASVIQEGIPIDKKYIQSFITSPGKIEGTFKGQKETGHVFDYNVCFESNTKKYVGLLFSHQVFTESFLILATYTTYGEMINALVLENQMPGQKRRDWSIQNQEIVISDYPISDATHTPLISKYRIDESGKIVLISAPKNTVLSERIQDQLLAQDYNVLFRIHEMKQTKLSDTTHLLYYDLGINHIPLFLSQADQLINQIALPSSLMHTKFDSVALKDVTGDQQPELLLYTKDTRKLFHEGKHLYIFQCPFTNDKTKLILKLTLEDVQMTDMTYTQGNIIFELTKLNFQENEAGYNIILKGISYQVTGQPDVKTNEKQLEYQYQWSIDTEKFIKLK